MKTVGFIDSGHAQGSLVLSNAHGSVTLQLTGPQQGGFDPISSSFSYTIAGASGRYKGDTGSGSLTLALVSCKTGHFTLNFAPQARTTA